jgi:CspA family cold shock protein
MKKGTIKFFNETKGFGFIRPENGNKDVFVHSSGLVDRVSEGDNVTYDEQDGKKGVNAVNVQIAN